VSLLADVSIKRFREKARALRAQYKGITDRQICSELNDQLGEYRDDPDIQEQIAGIVEQSRKETFSAKAGKRAAVPVRSVGTRCRMKNYPDYCIDPQGDLWDVDGKLIKKRWRNQRCWVQIYDHTGKRCERNVFWLMVEAGFVPDPRPKKE
jgi:hypothetical protein